MKRVIWVTGGKGGTGKSTFARGALDTLLTSGVNVRAFDGDAENPQLYRYYQGMGNGVVRTRLAERDGGDDILQAMEEEKPDVILADVAAGGSQILMRLQDDSLFLSSAREMDYDFIIVSVISPIKDSVNMLKETMDSTEGHFVQHVAVKNLKFGRDDAFELVDSSRTKERFEKAGGVVITMRDLMDRTYGAIDRENLPFSTAAKKAGGLPIQGDRNRVRQWLICLRDQMAAANGTFGL